MDFVLRLRTRLQTIFKQEILNMNTNLKIKESRISGLSEEDFAALAQARASESAAYTYRTSISQAPELILNLKDDSHRPTGQNLQPSKPSTPTKTLESSSKPTTGAPSYTESVILTGAAESAISSLSAKSYQVSGTHYLKYKIQPTEYIVANGIGFLAGNVIKYTTRYKDKNGADDIRKAIHYLNMILEFEYKS